MKIRIVVILINILLLISCSKQLLELEHGLYSYENNRYPNELNLLENNTFCKFSEMECVAMPQMNIGTFEETNDSIIFKKDKYNFLNKNIKYENDKNADFIAIKPYVLIGFLSGNRKWTDAAGLSIYVISNGKSEHLITKLFHFPTEDFIKIDKAKLINVEKILILDRAIEHTFEIEYNESLNKILTPTGFINMNVFERNSDIESYRLAKCKNEIKIIYSEKYKVKYSLTAKRDYS